MKLIYKNNNYQIQEITVEELNINGLELPLNKQITNTYAKNLTHQRLINALHKVLEIITGFKEKIAMCIVKLLKFPLDT